MGNIPSARTRQRIEDAVRAHERSPWELLRDRVPSERVPFEICMFEMTAGLALPQNGPGTATGRILRWYPEASHEGLDYDTAFDEPGLIGIDPLSWFGDMTTAIRPYDPNGEDERIFLLDTLRMHSKWATPTGDVGAYGVAWKPHEGAVKVDYRPEPLPVWFILTMQTPGPFYARLNAALDTNDVSQLATVFRLGDLGFGHELELGTGHRTVSGYDPFGSNWAVINAYDEPIVRVCNPPAVFDDVNRVFTSFRFHGEAEDVIYCEWHMRLNAYFIRGVEPNTRGWSTQTVVTSVTVDGGGHVTGQTSKDIKLPPWNPAV